VGRIIEFTTVPRKTGLQVRVAVLWRPNELRRYERLRSTPRLLVATMHTDTHSVGLLRGKCIVKHFCELQNREDLNEFCKKSDSFFFWQVRVESRCIRQSLAYR
jgi:hypothetical protein